MAHWVSPDWASKPTDVPYANFGNPQSLNLYGYVTNNPLSRADKDGHDPDEVVAAAAASSVLGPEAPLIVLGGYGLLLAGGYVHDHWDAISSGFHSVLSKGDAPASATTSKPTTSTPATPTPPENKGNKRTEHGEQRASEAKEGDPHRQVGDANRVKTEGKTYTDADTGNTVHVNGNRVVISDSEGNQVTQFENSRANTAQRVQDGKWVPNK